MYIYSSSSFSLCSLHQNVFLVSMFRSPFSVSLIFESNCLCANDLVWAPIVVRSWQVGSNNSNLLSQTPSHQIGYFLSLGSRVPIVCTSYFSKVPGKACSSQDFWNIDLLLPPLCLLLHRSPSSRLGHK